MYMDISYLGCKKKVHDCHSTYPIRTDTDPEVQWTTPPFWKNFQKPWKISGLKLFCWSVGILVSCKDPYYCAGLCVFQSKYIAVYVCWVSTLEWRTRYYNKSCSPKLRTPQFWGALFEIYNSPYILLNNWQARPKKDALELSWDMNRLCIKAFRRSNSKVSLIRLFWVGPKLNLCLRQPAS